MTTDHIIDSKTGEVVDDQYLPVPYEDQNEISVFGSPLLQAVMNGARPPLFIQKLLEKYPDNPDMVEWEYSLFAGAIPEDMNKYINKTVPVLGCTFLPHDDFVPFSEKDNPTGAVKKGYIKAFILIDEKDSDGNYKVLSVSGVNIFPAMALAMAARGWYMWDKPVKYIITRGGKGNAFFMRMAERPIGANKTADGKGKVTEK